MKKTLFVLIVLAVASLPLVAQMHDHAAMAKGDSGMNCAAMCAKHKQMSAEADAKLQKLVDQMNAATGQAKVDAMSAVITELLAQRKGMSCDMSKMSAEGKPMAHEMSAEAMKNCPMHGEKAAAAKKQ